MKNLLNFGWLTQSNRPKHTDITPHVTVLETVLAEVKVALTSENATAE